MSRIIHARIDGEAEKVLRQLQRRLGWNDSQAVREGIKALRALLGRRRARLVIGMGRFRSGVADLGSNEARLEGFGR